MKKENLYLSTIDPNAAEIARKHGLGLEIAEFCTAFNVDEQFEQTDTLVKSELSGVVRRVFHGPFNELFPCAVDPLARKLAAFRFDQALTLAQSYGIRKMVLHGGYNPRLYYEGWYEEQSILFWKEFMESHPGDFTICLENVLEETPESLLNIVKSVDDPRLRLCLDVGHVNAYSHVPAEEWIRAWGARLSHAHVHNNDGSADTHSKLWEGSLPIRKLLPLLGNATVTLELPDADRAAEWLTEQKLLEE